MKCDELKALVFSLNDLAYIDEKPATKNFENVHDHAVYKATDVDAAIAELKAENERLEKCCKEYDSRQRIDERLKFNGAQQLRATKRALWLARAYIMTLLQRDFQRLAYQCNNDDFKRNLLRRRNCYYDLSEKCIKKSKEYL